MDSPNPGLVRHMSYIKQDAVIRTIMHSLLELDVFCDEIRFCKEQIESHFRKLLEHLDAEPLASELNGPGI